MSEKAERLKALEQRWYQVSVEVGACVFEIKSRKERIEELTREMQALNREALELKAALEQENGQ